MKNPLKSRLVAVGGAAALMVGLGGVGGATASGLITNAQIKTGAVNGRTVQQQSLHSGDIAPNGVGDSEIRSSAVGVNDLNHFVTERLKSPPYYEVIGRTTDSTTNTGQQTITTPCAGHASAVGGGLKAAKPAEVTVESSYPGRISMLPGSTEWPNNGAGTWEARGWTVKFDNSGTGKVQPYVVCMANPDRISQQNLPY
ncbi:MAG: hypothetical protein ACRDPH_04805 [Marmoricola sp.]